MICETDDARRVRQEAVSRLLADAIDAARWHLGDDRARKECAAALKRKPGRPRGKKNAEGDKVLADVSKHPGDYAPFLNEASSVADIARDAHRHLGPTVTKAASPEALAKRIRRTLRAEEAQRAAEKKTSQHWPSTLIGLAFPAPDAAGNE